MKSEAKIWWLIEFGEDALWSGIGDNISKSIGDKFTIIVGDCLRTHRMPTLHTFTVSHTWTIQEPHVARKLQFGHLCSMHCIRFQHHNWIWNCELEAIFIPKNNEVRKMTNPLLQPVALLSCESGKQDTCLTFCTLHGKKFILISAVFHCLKSYRRWLKIKISQHQEWSP